MSNIASTKVKIYPSAYRGPISGSSTQYDPESNVLTENNLSSSVRNISERGFVVTDNFSEGKDLEFYLLGRYFKLLSFVVTDVESGYPDEIWVSARIHAQNPAAESGDNSSYANWVLVGYDNASTPLDSNDKFIGLSFSTEEPEASGVVGENDVYQNLLLLKKQQVNTYVVPESSKLKFNAADIKGGEDDGEEFALNRYLDTNKIKVSKITSSDGIVINSDVEINPENKLLVSSIEGNAGELNINSEEINISGDINLEGSISATGELAGASANISGNTATKTLSVSEEASFDSDVAVAGAIEGESASFTSNLSADSIKSNSIRNNSSILNSGEITNDGPIYSESLNIGSIGIIEENGNYTVGRTTSASITADGKASFNGRVSIKDGIAVQKLNNVIGGINSDGLSNLYIDSSKDIRLVANTGSGNVVIVGNENVSGKSSMAQATVSSVDAEDSNSVPNIGWIGNNSASIIAAGTGSLSQSVCLKNAAGDVLSSANLRKLIVDIVYPVGSIYVTSDSSLSTVSAMANKFGGSWKKIDAGTYLKAISSGQAGKYESATLPNIVGGVSDIEIHQIGGGHDSVFDGYTTGPFSLKYEDGEHTNYWGSGDSRTGYSQQTINTINSCLHAIETALPVLGNQLSTMVKAITGIDSGNGCKTFTKDTAAKRYLSFDANKANSTYQNGSTVNPPAYTVYIYERIN